MAAAGVPTAEARVCTSEAELRAALTEFGAPHVVKDDGLAAGKGVVVTNDFDEALAHGLDCLEGGVVIEELLDGPAVSLFCISDGEIVDSLETAHELNKLLDSDYCHNTGQCGAFCLY